jgi:two-component system sensor histidine kinase VicK
MGVRFRVWMPSIAVLIIVGSIALMLAYEIPAVDQRIGELTREQTLAQAAATADAITGENLENWQDLLELPALDAGDQAPRVDDERRSALQRSLDLYAGTTGGEIFVVNREGQVVARDGAHLFSPPPEILRSAADGERFYERTEGLDVAVVPILYGGQLTGGVVFATKERESEFHQLFLYSGLEAAAISSAIGAALMILLATILSRRVERLSSGARAMERGELSYRIKPGFGDELGELATAFNSMAANLESSFGQLKEKDTTLGTILDNLSEGVLATNVEGRVMFANPAARAMLGIDGEVPGKLPDPWEDFDLREAVAHCAGGRQRMEARVRDEKSVLKINLEHMPTFDYGRGGVLVVVQDLSEGRRLEAVQQRFLINAAHELRTPLSTIAFAAELLATGADEDPAARRRFLDHIQAASNRMQRLSEALLQLARAGWDTGEPQLAPVCLMDVTRTAAEGMEPLAESAGVKVLIEGPDARVFADPALLEQALLILISNAIKHSDPGAEIVLRTSSNSITVEDHGAGIAPEDLPHLFERFYLGEGVSEGVGLGLPICKELVEKMGGEISVRSQKGVGTAVEITLPKVGPDA